MGTVGNTTRGKDRRGNKEGNRGAVLGQVKIFDEPKLSAACRRTPHITSRCFKLNCPCWCRKGAK